MKMSFLVSFGHQIRYISMAYTTEKRPKSPFLAQSYIKNLDFIVYNNKKDGNKQINGKGA